MPALLTPEDLGERTTSSRCKLQSQQVLVVVAVAAVIVVLVLLFLELCPGWRLRASEVDISQRQRVAVIRKVVLNVLVKHLDQKVLPLLVLR